MKITVLACVATLSACSGTTPYSTTYNAVDYAYASETTSHLRSTIEFADIAADRDPLPAARRAAADWARLARSEVRAIDGLIGAVKPPISAAASATHVREHRVTAYPTATTSASGTNVLRLLVRADEATLESASDYLPRGRQPSLKSISAWMVEDRTAEAETLRRLLLDVNR